MFLQSKVDDILADLGRICQEKKWRVGRVKFLYYDRWKGGRVEEWKSGRVEEWKGGREDFACVVRMHVAFGGVRRKSRIIADFTNFARRAMNLP